MGLTKQQAKLMSRDIQEGWARVLLCSKGESPHLADAWPDLSRAHYAPVAGG